MWKLFIFTILCLVLRTSCDDVTSGDVKTTQIAAAAAQTVTSSNGDSESASAVAVAKITSVKTEDPSDPSSGSGKNSNSNGGSNGDGNSSKEDEDTDCNPEERDDDYDCTNALPRVKQAIIKIAFQRLKYFFQNNFVNNNNYCDNDQTQGKEGVTGSPVGYWYLSAIAALNTEKETLDELLSYTGLENKNECRCVMILLRRSIKPLFKGFFYFSPNIAADYKYNFTESYKRDVFQYLDGSAFNSDFNRPQMSARKENKIAAAKTGNVIQNVISKQDASTVFNNDQIIINIFASYLKPVFKMSFNLENTTKGIYYGLDEPIITDFLYQEVIYNSTKSRSLNARLMEIPITNENSHFIVIVPNTRCGLPSLVAKLASEPQILVDEIECLQPTRIRLTTPAFKSVTTVMNLVPVLQKTSEINRVFDINKSQVIDSCGRPLKRSLTYIYEKSTTVLSPIGIEPYKKAEASDCPECGEPVNVRLNYPNIFVYFVKGVIVECVVATVPKVDSFTN